MFLNLRKSGLLVNLKKCDLGVTKLVYLGFEINKDGYSADPKKVAGIVNARLPKTLHGVCSFVGMLQFYRNAIPRYPQLTKPLTFLTSLIAQEGKSCLRKRLQLFIN